MKRKQKEVEDKIPSEPMEYKTLDLLKMIRDEYSDFQGLTDNDKKINSLMDFSFGVFLYTLIRYDNSNYRKVFCKTEDK